MIGSTSIVADGGTQEDSKVAIPSNSFQSFPATVGAPAMRNVQIKADVSSIFAAPVAQEMSETLWQTLVQYFEGRASSGKAPLAFKKWLRESWQEEMKKDETVRPNMARGTVDRERYDKNGFKSSLPGPANSSKYLKMLAG